MRDCSLGWRKDREESANRKSFKLYSKVQWISKVAIKQNVRLNFIFSCQKTLGHVWSGRQILCRFLCLYIFIGRERENPTKQSVVGFISISVIFIYISEIRHCYYSLNIMNYYTNLKQITERVKTPKSNFLVDYHLEVVSSIPGPSSNSSKKGKKVADPRYPQGMDDRMGTLLLWFK